MKSVFRFKEPKSKSFCRRFAQMDADLDQILTTGLVMEEQCAWRKS
jgi:hypothetical protein